MPVAGGDERNGVAARRGAVGQVRVAVHQAEVGESSCAERQADVAGEPGRFPVAGPVHPGVQLDGAAGTGILELEVQHARDGVGAVLGRRAVAQHLDLAQRNRGDGGDVGALRAERHAVAAVPVDYRGAMPALAVDQYQRVVRGQVAQHGGADHRRYAADRLGVGAERRDDGAELVLQIARALADEIDGRQHVDRHRRRGGAARLRAGADDHRFLRESREQPLHLGGRQPQGFDLIRRHPQYAGQYFDGRVRLGLHLFPWVGVLRLGAGGGWESGPCRHEHGEHQGCTPRRGLHPRGSRLAFLHVLPLLVLSFSVVSARRLPRATTAARTSPAGAARSRVSGSTPIR